METVTMSLGVHDITLIVLNETRAKIKQNQPTSKQTKTKEDFMLHNTEQLKKLFCVWYGPGSFRYVCFNCF